MRLACLVAISGLTGSWQFAQAAAGYAGATACGGCHPAEFVRQSSSAHAGALYRASDHPLAASLPGGLKLTRKPRYRFEFIRAGGELQTRIFDGVDVMDLPMEWAFGAGKQAVTFVTRIDKDWYVEHYPTYYPRSGKWGATPGQEEILAGNLPEAAGRVYSTSDPAAGIAGCFECHSTGPVSFGPAGEAGITETGVRCEGCHGPGAAHAANPSRYNIRNPKNLSARELNQFCGTCHRQPAAAPGETGDWNSSWNVRHQPIYLNESACFRRSQGALTCLTCHDPHEPSAKKAPASYNSRCVACHSRTAPRPKPVCEARTRANCVDCHMPLVSPQAQLRFTNHWIGVYASGAKLKPVR
jgi:hypothetical protein